MSHVEDDAQAAWVARAEAAATAAKKRNPKRYALQCEAQRTEAMRPPAERQRRYGRLKPLELTRRQAVEIIGREVRVHVPARTLEDRAPRPRRRSSRARARAPARPEDPEPPLDLTSLREIGPAAFDAILRSAGL